MDAEEEVAHGLQSYFDKTLLACLLYRNERGQAAQVWVCARCACHRLCRHCVLKLPVRVDANSSLKELVTECGHYIVGSLTSIKDSVKRPLA